jgi:Tfp pilus assembly protein PilF
VACSDGLRYYGKNQSYIPPGDSVMRMLHREIIFKCCAAALALTMIAWGPGLAQRNRTLRARVLMPDGSQSQSVKIRLEGNEGELIRDSFTDSTGNFEVRNLGTGIYTITVPSDDRRYGTTTERVEITRYSPDVVAISVYLEAKEESGPRRKGERHTISAKEATVSIPKKAREAYDLSVDLSRHGKTREAIEELKRAIAIYPEYFQAYNDLGVAYIKLDLIDDAIKVLERSATLDPKAFNPRLNLGIANVRRQDFPRAEPHLRAAIAIDSSLPLAHLYLGITFWKTARAFDAEDEFTRALSLGGSDIAIAHYYLGQLYASKNRIADAVAELEAYLKQKPDSDDAQQARQKIAELRSRQK